MHEATVAPVLVLGLGNMLLRDDGLGLEVLAQLEARHEAASEIDFVDGGTKGNELLGFFDGRRAVLLVDAVASDDDEPGTPVHLREPSEQIHAAEFGAHGGNASGLLVAAALTGVLPERVELVGAVPQEVHTGLGLSQPVATRLDETVELAEKVLHTLCEDCGVQLC